MREAVDDFAGTWPRSATAPPTPSGPTSAMWSPCSTTPPGWARRPGRADLDGAAQLARPAAHDRRRPHVAGPPGRGRPHVHRLGPPDGPAAADVGAGLASPKAHRDLPHRAARRPGRRPASTGAAPAAADAGAGRDGLRCGTRLLLELLYATGIRVSELCGLDVDDVDRAAGCCGCSARAAKERTVPYGLPASARSTPGCAAGGPPWPAPASGGALLLGARGGRLNPTTARRIVGRVRRARRPAPHHAARAAPLGRHPPARGRRRPALGAGAARPRLAGQHADLHARLGRAAARGLPARPTPAPDRPRRCAIGVPPDVTIDGR